MLKNLFLHQSAASLIWKMIKKDVSDIGWEVITAYSKMMLYCQADKGHNNSFLITTTCCLTSTTHCNTKQKS